MIEGQLATWLRDPENEWRDEGQVPDDAAACMEDNRCPHCEGDQVMHETNNDIYLCIGCVARIAVNGHPTRRGIALWWARGPKGGWVRGSRFVMIAADGTWGPPTPHRDDPSEAWVL